MQSWSCRDGEEGERGRWHDFEDLNNTEGCISVGESELFYYFVESQNNPASDPLFIWLSGGPGCSSITGLLHANGIGHLREWKRCNWSLSDSYNKDVSSVVDIYQYHSTKNDLQVLVQSSCISHNPMKVIRRVYLEIYIVLILSVNAVLCGSPVEYLPGYSGKLPFKLQTGYVSVGESELFYYFVESQDNPPSDPLFLWLSGGPGCSSTSGLLHANGPIRFDGENYNGGLPKVVDYPYSWTQNASFIYVDAPVGTGFSYSTTQQGWSSSDSKSAEQTFQFIIKWLEEHPRYLMNSLFIGGDSYSGITVPMIVKKIIDANEVGEKPSLQIKGYLVGSPLTDYTSDANSRFIFAHRMYLISDELYESAKASCKMEFINIDPSNAQCLHDVQAMERCIKDVNKYSILEPICDWTLLEPNSANLRERSLQEEGHQFLQQSNSCERVFVINTLPHIWSNDESVQDALHVRKGHIRDWKRCNWSLSDSYNKDVSSVIDIHQYLTSKDLQVLVQSGDHDIAITVEGTMKWLKSLNLTIEQEWRAWLHDGQVLGFTRLYSNGSAYRLTFATVMGAGHVAPEYKREECYHMFQRWIQSHPL